MFTAGDNLKEVLQEVSGVSQKKLMRLKERARNVLKACTDA